MADNSHYGGIIWTHHALERLGQRGLSKDMALQAFKAPDSKSNGKQSGTYEFRKKFGISTVTLIAKQNEKKEWVVFSCWIDPPNAGTRDWKEKQYYNAYKRAGVWGKLWIIFKRQLGV